MSVKEQIKQIFENRIYNRIEVEREGKNIFLKSPMEVKEGDKIQVHFGEPRTIRNFETWLKQAEKEILAVVESLEKELKETEEAAWKRDEASANKWHGYAELESRLEAIHKLAEEMPTYQDLDDVGGMEPVAVQMFGISLDEWKKKLLAKLEKHQK